MGGVNGGGIASSLAVECIKKEMENFKFPLMGESEIKDFLLEAVKTANLSIFKKSREDDELAGMGTTVVFAVVIKDMLHIVHVGDSRAYIINDKEFKQLTVDHSIVQEMINSGEITEDQAKNHPRKNIITRALGIEEEVKLDYIKVYIKKGDTILICTDGLTNHVEKDDILKEFKKEPCMPKFIDNLIDLAKTNGGSDNITVVTIS
jgi:protein phosphatase